MQQDADENLHGIPPDEAQSQRSFTSTKSATIMTSTNDTLWKTFSIGTICHDLDTLGARLQFVDWDARTRGESHALRLFEITPVGWCHDDPFGVAFEHGASPSGTMNSKHSATRSSA